MAENPSGAGGSAFEILGRVEIDLAALKKSLSAAETEVRASGDRLQRIWSETAKAGGQALGGGPGGPRVPTIPGGGAGEGEGGGGGEPGRGGAAHFAHMARVIRHILIPALSQLDPEMGRFISVGAQSARTAVFFGGAIGAAAVAASVLSAVMGQYLKAAKEATASTLEVSRSLATLDSARAEAAIKKIDEAVAEYNIQQDIASGKIESGFWQKLVAWSAIASEAVTGSIDTQVKKIKELLAASVDIGKLTLVPEAAIEESKNAAELLGKQAQLAITNAADVTALSAAYDMNALSIKNNAKAVRDKLDLDDQNKKRVLTGLEEARVASIKAAGEKKALKILEQAELGAGEFGGASTETLKQAEIDADKARADAKKEADEVAVLSDEEMTQKLLSNAAKRKKSSDDEAQDLKKNSDTERKARAQAAVEHETFVQNEIARVQKRIEGAAATAESIAQSEEKIAQVRRQHLSTVESANSLEVRLNESRERTIGPILSAIEAANEKYRSQKRALEELIDANISVEKNTERLAEVERERADEVLGLNQKIARETEALAAKAEEQHAARVQREIALEEKRVSHLVAMGRVTMQEEMSYQRGAAADPRRSVEQQESAEEKLLQLKKQYADDYFRYYQSLGVSTWAAQLESAKYFLSETVEGSKQWFEAVQRVADVYKGIQEQAKGIFQQEVSIAEAQARKAGRTTMGIGDIAGYVEKQRREDERALSGARVPIGAISGAVGRQDLWKTVDREGLTPGVAFQRMMQDPQQQLGQTLGAVNTKMSQYSNVTDVVTKSVYDLGSAAGSAAAALQSVAEAAGGAAAAMTAARAEQGPEQAPGVASSGGVLTSEGGRYTNAGVNVATDSALGRNLQLGARRGPNAVETVQ